MLRNGEGTSGQTYHGSRAVTNKQTKQQQASKKGSRAVVFKSRPAASFLENVQEACNDDDKTTSDDMDVDPFVVKTIQDNLTSILFVLESSFNT